jgi:hypothetical protein
LVSDASSSILDREHARHAVCDRASTETTAAARRGATFRRRSRAANSLARRSPSRHPATARCARRCACRRRKAGSVASANKTNIGANALAQKLGVMGKANLALSVGLGAARIATAENKVEESARVAGGVLGGIGTGALVGAQLGAMGANPVTIGIGAVVGGIAGGILGEAAVNHAISWAKSWF